MRKIKSMKIDNYLTGWFTTIEVLNYQIKYILLYCEKSYCYDFSQILVTKIVTNMTESHWLAGAQFFATGAFIRYILINICLL